MDPFFEPNNRFFRRHGQFSELRTRTMVRKAEEELRMLNNPNLKRHHFMHQGLRFMRELVPKRKTRE